ncbi:AraC family transcriptional regulator [Rhodococcus sp. WAY2]|uniref:AraC family transcriptional regulator n=1 Tax=Rhodococcus sp. WAY2 TaxID=2663121 RepID=UPI00132026DA|nr:AraC family transcriptional regulator [Rhodococcus sp. WAY2]QHE66894.1 Transcriptional regulator, AraC family [Rhodococcus sp. WAY2]
MSTIRSAALRGFRATVAELGGDADELARLAGLPPVALDSDDMLVADLAVVRILESAARVLDCPDLGLRVAARQDLGMLGPLALAIRNAPTVADAIECTSRYLFLHARGMSIAMEADPNGARGVLALRYEVSPDGLPVSVQGVDLGLGFVHRTIESLMGGRYGLRSVDLPYRPAAPIDRYEKFFGAPVRIARPAALLRVPRSITTHPLLGADEALMRLALTFLARQAPSHPAPGTATQVQAAVLQSLGTTPPEIGVVARLLAMHPRTLQRRLAAEGTSFAAILDEVRRKQTRRYLTTTDMPMSQIAALVGLTEQSTLTRCCRRWWNATPREVRRGALTR